MTSSFPSGEKKLEDVLQLGTGLRSMPRDGTECTLKFTHDSDVKKYYYGMPGANTCAQEITLFVMKGTEYETFYTTLVNFMEHGMNFTAE